MDGQIVGGIGISSGTAEQDRLIAEAAVVKFHAKIGLKA